MEEIRVTDKMWEELNAMPFFYSKFNPLKAITPTYREEEQNSPPAQIKCQAYSRVTQTQALRSF